VADSMISRSGFWPIKLRGRVSAMRHRCFDLILCQLHAFQFLWWYKHVLPSIPESRVRYFCVYSASHRLKQFRAISQKVVTAGSTKPRFSIWSSNKLEIYPGV
jgi:hypothetical protein